MYVFHHNENKDESQNNSKEAINISSSNPTLNLRDKK
jgi:hypothetical protein